MYFKAQCPEYNAPIWLTKPEKDGTKTLGSAGKRWQVECFNGMKDKRFVFIIAYCGSGKTLEQVALGIHDVVSSNWTQKQLVLVPQQHISEGFTNDGVRTLSAPKGNEYIRIRFPDGAIRTWQIDKDHNFCDKNSSDIKAKLKEWLLATPASLVKKYSRKKEVIRGLSAVTTHAALAGLWSELSADEKRRAIRNLTIRLDEAHHVSGVFDDEEGLSDEQKLAIQRESTILGEICQFLVNSLDKTSKLHMTTATPFRGDGSYILFPKIMDKFVEGTYKLDFLEHWKTLGIERMEMLFEQHDHSPIDQMVQNIASEPSEKHMVVVPATGQKWRRFGNEHMELIDKLRDKGLRVLDLVTQSTQAANKALLLQEPKDFEDAESKYDVVVTCMLGREGTDWCPCSRLHNAACEGSPTLAAQTFGRIFRRFRPNTEEGLKADFGKIKVKVIYYVKKFSSPKKDIPWRELFSDRLNALLVLMQIDDMFSPMFGQPLQPELLQPELEDETGEVKSDTVPDALGDQYNAIRRTAMEAWVRSHDMKYVRDVVASEYGNLLRDMDPEAIEKIMEVIVLRGAALWKAKSEMPPLPLIDISYIRRIGGFDKVIEELGLEKCIFCTEDDLGGRDLKEVRDIYRRFARERISKEQYLQQCMPYVLRCCPKPENGVAYWQDIDRLRKDTGVYGKEFSDHREWDDWRKTNPKLRSK